MTDHNFDPNHMVESENDGRVTLVFKLARKKFAIGLHWLVPQTDEMLKEVRRSAGERDANLAVIRNGDAKQYGIGRKSDGLRPGSISAAAALSDRIKGSFCGIFEVAGGWWFVSQRDDLLTPHGDCFYQHESAALGRFNLEAAKPGWQEVYAPASWNITGTKDLNPAEILMAAKGPKIAGISPLSGNIIPIVVVAALVAGGLFGVQQFFHYKAVREHAEQLQAKKAKEDAKRKSEAKKNVQLPPWPDQPHAVAVIEDCQQGFKKMTLDLPGWDLASWKCSVNDKSLVTKYTWAFAKQADPASAAWLYTFLQSTYGAETVEATTVAQNGKVATTTLPGNKLTRRGDEALPADQQAIVALTSFAATMQDATRLSELRTVKQPPNVKQGDWQPPHYAWHLWVMDTKNIDDLRLTLDKLPGVIVSEVDFNPKTYTYTLKGFTYVQQ